MSPQSSATHIRNSGNQSYRTPSRPFTLQSHEVDSNSGRSGIVVYVPEGAKVFVNDHKMKTGGTARRFASGQLEAGKTYEYEIRAEMVRNGVNLVRTETVKLKAGRVEEVGFDFTDTVAPIQAVAAQFPDTKLTVVVPEDASVFLAGEDTVSVGNVRKFVTNDIADGKAWKDYEIRVEVERDGKTIVKTKKISLFAGDEKEFEFKFPVDKKVASLR